MSSPNYIFPFISFFIITIIYYIIKLVLVFNNLNKNIDNKSHTLSNHIFPFLKETNFFSLYDIVGFSLVIIILFFSQFSTTVYNSKLLCGTTQISYSVLNTSLCWGLFLIVFIIANVLWLKPFSNTLGYLFLTYCMDLSNRIKNIFPKKYEEFIGKEWVFVNEFVSSLDPKTFKLQFDSISSKSQKGGAIEHDNHPQQPPYTGNDITNENAKGTPEPVTTLPVKNLTKKQDKTTDNNHEPINHTYSVSDKAYNLYTLIRIKTLISEFIWFSLIGLLALSFSYSHLLGNSCYHSPDNQLEQYNMNKMTDAVKDEKNKQKEIIEPKRKYVSN